MSDIVAWLTAQGFGAYAPHFVEEEIDLDALRLLDDADLKGLGLPLGPRRKLLHAVEQLTVGVDTSPTESRIQTAAASPYGLASRVLLSEDAALGERKFVTVLFADLRGSTALIEHLDAESAVERLGPAVQEMIHAVQRFEGTVNRVQGDGIMALFGAPVAHEDHTLRACMAGLAIRDAIVALGDDALQPRVGVHAGEAVVRSIYNDLTVEYEADGPAVHLAARMEQSADSGTVRTTREVWRVVDGHVEGRALGALPVKGYSELVTQFELLGVSNAASRWEGRARRGLSRFVGRSRELATLQQAAADAIAGDGRVVALIGEAGMGKSRLVHEFLASPTMGSWTLRVAAASPHGKRTPYLPLRQLLRAVIGAQADDFSDMIAVRLTAHLEELGEGAEALRAPLLALLDQEPSDAEWKLLEPSGRRRRVIEAMCELALARARSGPLLFVLEDLHWADDETQEVLDRLADSVGAVAMLLLTTSRPEHRSTWYGKSYFVPVHIGAINATDVHRLLDELLGTDASLDQLRAEIEARAEGRPLYIEEVVRELVDRGVLSGGPGDRLVAKPDAPIPIPESVQAVIGARIDRLEPDHKRLLQVAAVIGRTVPQALLANAAAMPEATLRMGLAALQDAEFLFLTQSFPAPEYLFKHALIEAVAYESLLRRRRRAIHEAVLRALEAQHAGRLEEHVTLLAHHAFGAELWPEAVQHFRAAGVKAIASSAYREAVAHLDQALVALENMPESAERTSLGIEIRLDLRPALGANAEYERLLTRLEEARVLARSIGDDSREAHFAADSVHVLYHVGQMESAITTGEEAIRAARALGDPRTLLLACANYSQAHYFAGDFERARQSGLPLEKELRTTFRHARIGTTCTSSCLWLGNLCGVQAAVGEFDKGIELGKEACRIAAETGLPIDQVMSGNWLAWCHALRGDGEAVLEIAERNLDIVTRNDLTFPEHWVTVLYALGLAATDEADRAQRQIEAFHERGAAPGTLVLSAIWLASAEASVLYDCGDHESAAKRCTAVLERIDRYGIRVSESSTLRILGNCKMAAGTTMQAREYLERARTVACARGARPDIAHADLSLARLCASEGKAEASRSAATRAYDAYVKMGMSHWLAAARTLTSA